MSTARPHGGNGVNASVRIGASSCFFDPLTDSLLSLSRNSPTSCAAADVLVGVTIAMHSCTTLVSRHVITMSWTACERVSSEASIFIQSASTSALSPSKRTMRLKTMEGISTESPTRMSSIVNDARYMRISSTHGRKRPLVPINASWL